MEIEKSENIKKIIRNYEKKRTKTEKKYQSEEKQMGTTKDLKEKALKEIEVKIRKSDLHKEKLQEDLSNVSPSDKELIEEFEKTFQKIEDGYMDEYTGKWIPGKKEYLEEKQKLEKEYQIERNHWKNVKH